MKRRPNGTGTIKEYKDGNRAKPFRAFTPPMWVDGELKPIPLGSFETRIEAEDALYKWRKTRGTKNNYTLKDLYDEWSEKAYQNIVKSTADCYRAAWKQMANLYKEKVSIIRTGHFQEIVDLMKKAGKSYSSIHNVKVLAGLLEKYAMSFDIIEKNYAEFIVLPEKPDDEKETFTVEQIKKLEEEAKAGDLTAKLIVILNYTGWRIGEFLNLTVDDYDAKNKTFTGGLKTEAGKNRVVPIHPYIQGYVDELVAMGGPKLVCRAEERGKSPNKYTVLVPITTNYFRNKMFYPLMERLEFTNSKGEPFTPHVTRHTFASACRKQEIDPVVVKRLMGHSRGQDVTESVYTHVDLEMLVKAIEQLIFYKKNKK